MMNTENTDTSASLKPFISIDLIRHWHEHNLGGENLRAQYIMLTPMTKFVIILSKKTVFFSFRKNNQLHYWRQNSTFICLWRIRATIFLKLHSCAAYFNRYGVAT
jgi:hypothetical protein